MHVVLVACQIAINAFIRVFLGVFRPRLPSIMTTQIRYTRVNIHVERYRQ
jgi:hypothetical protein